MSINYGVTSLTIFCLRTVDPESGNVHNYCAMCGGYSSECEIANIDVLYRVEFACVHRGDTWRMRMNDQLFAAALTDILVAVLPCRGICHCICG